MLPNRFDFENNQREINRLKDELESLRTGESRVTAARYTTAAGQSINNTTWTIVNFGTSVYDTQGRVTTGAAWKFTARVGGYYSVAAMVMFTATTAWAAGEEAELAIYKNGVLYDILDRKDNFSATSQFKELTGSDLVYLAAGDYLDVRVYQASGGALALHNNAAYNHVAVWKIEA